MTKPDRPRWDRKALLLVRLRSTWIEETYHEQTVGFLGSDAFTSRSEVSTNPDGEEAAKLIENLFCYVQHETGCDANDLDYLDKSPCTCGLRDYYNPKGQSHEHD